ncbi:hypothetical protein GCM10027594_01930 [Hymenobacter agri]
MGFSACHKAQVDPAEVASTSIVGRWALTKTSGGIGGGTRLADSTQGIALELRADGQALLWRNGTPTPTAYTLRERAAYLTQRPETFLEFQSSPGNSSFISELTATTLVLRQDANDGITATYHRDQPLLCGTR